MSEARRGPGRLPDDGTGNRGGGKRLVGHSARVKINITIDPDLLAQVDAYAANHDLGNNRSQAIADLIAKALQG